MIKILWCISPYKNIDKKVIKKDLNNNYSNINNNICFNYIKQISTEKINKVFMNEKETEIISIKSEIKGEFNFNNKYIK